MERVANILSTTQQRLLLETLARTEALETVEQPPRWAWWKWEPLEQQREHGPRFSGPSWFGSPAAKDRMRFLRALRELERAGLVQLHRPWGRLVNVKLTDEGIQVSKQLKQEMQSEVCP